jgi:hypothetical protein
VKPKDPSGRGGKPASKIPTLRLQWRNITAKQAITAICENYGLDMAKDAPTGTIRISPRSSGESKLGWPEKEKGPQPE